MLGLCLVYDKRVFIQPHKTRRNKRLWAVNYRFSGLRTQFIAAYSEFQFKRAGKTCQVDILCCYCKLSLTEIQRKGSNFPLLAVDKFATVCVLVFAVHHISVEIG